MTNHIHEVALINSDRYGVVGHKAGCKDIARDEKKQGGDEAWVFGVASKHEAYLEYNSDFIAESGSTEGHWDIRWMACASHVPETFTPEGEPVEKDVTVTAKKGSKWTYIYVGRVLVAEVRNDQVGTVLDFFKSQS